MTTDSETWLGRIAGAADIHERALRYDEWAPTYDADMLSTGYPNVAVAAALVGRYVAPAGARLLDAGAGTGLLGHILKAVGYTDIVGIDISPGMLARARERRAYRELQCCVLGEPLAFAEHSFTLTTAVGVFAFGHAPPSALDELLRVTAPGGYLIFNVNAPPWEQGGFKEKVESLESAGRWERVEVAGPYQPMPLSGSRGHITTRAFVFRVR